ncbi:hypothetical protein KVR01_011241 [Diaporthe batatas]|uniref:uncharacterized protein n=1 Tax=Diaporthe batatas TaxID=748121 RepID=UPI001D0496C6|nr:uncharacterized protein KVR01_011241 [Diaporthe batatas]KAG8158798.1 hypothetical protein KVR01_011241 [Diaporthe batatas]
MTGSQCVFNPATALRRVFMPSNVGRAHSLHLTRIFVPALFELPPQARAYWAGRDQGTKSTPIRHSSLFDRESHAPRTPPPNALDSLHARRTARASQQQKKKKTEEAPVERVKVKLGRMPRDEEIAWPYVHVKPPPGAVGHPSIDIPRPLKEVLAELDRKTTYLEALAVPDPEEKGSPRWPVCRVVNKMEEMARLKDIRDRKKKGAVKEKEVELTWTLAPHDLDHKLKTLQKFLNKGYKVQVLIQKKVRGKATANESDAKELIERVTKAIQEVNGAKEWKGREGVILGNYRIFLHGKAQGEAAAEAAVVAKDVAKDTPAASSDVAETSEGTSTVGQSQA